MTNRLTAPILAVLALFALISATPATAQQQRPLLPNLQSNQSSQTTDPNDIQRIVAVVNDQVISAYDLNLRMALIIGSSGGVTSQDEYLKLRKQVLDTMIDEKLEIQEVAQVAKKQNAKDLVATKDDIDDAIDTIAKNNRMTRQQFEQYLESIGSNISTLRPQIEASIVWPRLISGRYGAQTRVSDEEVETVMKRLMESAGEAEYRVSEIYLTPDIPGDKETTRDLAMRITKQVRAGTPFESLARQFSKAASAANGGDLGWVQADQVSGPIGKALKTMNVGEVSDPIAADNGYYVVRLRDRRRILGVDPMDQQMSVKQITLSTSADATQDETNALKAHVEAVSKDRDGCANTAAIAADLGTSSFGDVGTVRLRDVPQNVRNVLEKLKIGEVSEPFLVGNQMQMLIVCKRQSPKVKPPSFDEIEDRLVNQRLSLIARRYLRDLRSDAIIDYR